MTAEQNLIAALKEAIEEIRLHHSQTFHHTVRSKRERWLAIRVTCIACDGHGRVTHYSRIVSQPLVVSCQTCTGTGTRPLSEVN